MRPRTLAGKLDGVPPEDRYLDLPTGIRAHYSAWPAPDGAPPVVLNHATGFLGRLWEPIAERLAGDFAPVAPDTRGHGDSDKPMVADGAYHWARFVDDLRAFLDALGLRGLPFVGHSAGAASGLFLAAEEPGRFSRIVAIEPIVMPGGFTPDEERRAQMADGARRRRAVFESAGDAFAHYRGRSLFERWPDEMLRLYVDEGTFRREAGQLQLKCPGEVEGEVFANSGSLDVWEALPRIEAPLLVIRGEHTEEFLGMVAQAVADRVPNGRLETIAGAGHLAPMELPEKVAEMVIEFLRD